MHELPVFDFSQLRSIDRFDDAPRPIRNPYVVVFGPLSLPYAILPMLQTLSWVSAIATTTGAMFAGTHLNGDTMTTLRPAPTGDRVIEPMIALAGCRAQHRIMVAGSRSIEQTLELHRRGYQRAAATANCGHPAGQYDVALVDWRRRTFKALETTLDWLVDFLSPGAMLVVWVDPQKPAASQNLRAALERRGFVIEGGTVHDCGCAVSARRRETAPFRQAA